MGNDADFLNNPRLLDGITIRARASYYLAVAESVFAAAPPDDGSLEIARQAMNMAWQWIEGASVEADELDGCLEDEDTGLQFFIKNNTSITISAALAYVIWGAYQAEGRKVLPQTINEVTEQIMILDLHRFAELTGRFDHQLARRLLNYLRANYTTSKIDDLGGPILQRDIASGADIEILK